MTTGWRDEDLRNANAFLSAVRDAATSYGKRYDVERVAPSALDATIAAGAPVGVPTAAEFREFARRDQFWPQFLLTRSLERLGRATYERDDDYVLALVGLGTRGGREETIARLLRDDVELRDDVLWRIFEVEGGGEVSFTRGESAWTAALIDLGADGTIDRRRVLRSALEALGRDFSSYRAGGFRRLYDAFEPTPDERAADQDLLWPLFSASVTQTVSWAVKAVAALEKAKRLDDDAYVAAAPAAVVGTKAAASATIRLLGAVSARRPQVADAAAAVLADALAHPDATVQTQAAAMLERIGRGDAVTANADVLAPSVRATLGIIPDITPGGSDDVDVRADEDGAIIDVPAGLPEADDAVVADLLPAALEDAVDAVVFETVLARIAAVGIDDALASTLRKRALAVLDREGTTLRRTAAAIIAAWTDAPPVDVEAAVARRWRIERLRVDAGGDQPWPLSDRTADAIARAATRTVGITLWATPTDDAGRVDPYVLVQRAAAEPAPSEADAAGALLRLSADGRAAALAAVNTHDGDTTDAVQALRFALGGSAPSRDAVVRSPRLWAAAARARGERAVLADAGLDEPGWGIAQAAVVVPTRVVWGENDRWSAWRYGVDVATPSDRLPAAWTVQRVATDGSYFGDDLRAAEWAAVISPDDLEPFASRLLAPLARLVEWDEVDHRIVPALDGLRRTTGRPGPIAAACVVVALGAKHVGARAEAVELFADMTLRRGALDALVDATRVIAPGVPAPRWASTLAEIAGMSTALAAHIRTLLVRSLDAFARNHQRIGSLLQLLLDECLRAGERLEDAQLRDWLGGFTGSSAATKTARRLLELT